MQYSMDPMTPMQSPALETHEPPAGVVNLYKPVGRSSAQFVYKLRPVFGIRKIGHAGTLDPFADGVLLACVGKATRLVEQLMGLPKRYRTTLRLGVTNATFDTDHPFETVANAHPPNPDEISAYLQSQIGTIEQLPPQFSAIKIGGVASYKLARSGKAAELKPRPVRIDDARLLHYEWPRATIEILCGRGTYIRSIARDLGRALACGACCETLTRLAVGPFRLENAARFDPQTAPSTPRLHSIPEVLSLIGGSADSASPPTP